MFESFGQGAATDSGLQVGFGSTLDVIGDSLLALAVVVAIGASVALGQALVRSTPPAG